MRIGYKLIILLAPAIIIMAAVPALAQHGWPIEAANSEHAIGNSFGEFQDFAGVYKHTGIDILEVPELNSDGTVNTSAPWVIVTVGGTVSSLSDNASTLYNGTEIQGTDGVDYRYWHLEHNSYDANYVNADNNGTAVSAGDRIAKLVRWTCDYHHLHYDLADGGDYLNPLADITPNPDPDLPEIDDIGFAQDNSDPWVEFNSAGPGGCIIVSGLVDIIMKCRDQDDAGSTLDGAITLWGYDVRWRACPDSDPNCTWETTHAFDDMPTAWGVKNNAATQAYFSNRAPWNSSSNYCSGTWNYAVVTNFSGGTPNVVGTWDTGVLSDGSYSVSVEVTDFAGNSRVYNERVCVLNGAGCVTELTVRDANDDNGAIPYPGGNWWLSPDITANPGTPDEDHNINLGAANPIEVRVWNYGACDVTAGTTYDVCLGWGQPSASVPYPLPAGQVIDCITETTPVGGWSVGTSRVTNFTWTPDPADVPQGHHCLVAWVTSAQDPVLNTPAVNQDDNRAQQNITFQAAPEPGAAGYSSFWVFPQEMIRKRSLELTFKYSGARPTIKRARLHVPPGLVIENVLGGEVMGGYEGHERVDPCKLDPSHPCRDICLSWEEAHKLGCTRIIGGINPYGRLLLEGLRPRRPIKLTLEVWFGENVPKGGFVDVQVVEFGMLRNQEQIAQVGGLTIRFEQ